MSSLGALSGGSSGSVTGQLDVQWIVEQIIYAKQQPIRDLETFEVFYEAKKEAFQEVNTRVSALESAIYKMNNSGFETKSASVSTENYFTATATSSADNGQYTIYVDQLAAAQSDTSDGFNSADDQLLSNSTIEIWNFDSSEKLGEVDYSGSTTSLNGLKNSINSLGLDVTASVINFGTASSPNYKLQLTSEETGTENGFNIVETPGGQLNLATKIAAADAQIYVNTNPIANPTDFITRSSNTITDVINGVTLRLNAADDTKPTTLTISGDSSVLRENIQAFVTQYNEVMDYLNAHFTYDEEKERAGVLSGEAAALKIKQDLLSLATGRTGGVTGRDKYNSFAVIGLEINQTGELQINEELLNDALENHLDEVKQVLKDVGSTTNSDTKFVGVSDDTVAGTYSVHVDVVAERALAQGAAAIAATLAQDEVLTITAQGKNYTINLTSGMTDDQVVTQINTDLDDAGGSAFAQINSDTGKLEILSQDYGSGNTVKVVSDIASGAGGTGIGTTLISDTGVNVEGTIDGNAASGSGRILTGISGDSKGLLVNVSATSLNDAINGDDKGTVTFTLGVAERLRERMYELSFPYSGLLAKNIESYEDKLDDISDKIKSINRHLESEQAILITQFTRANEALAQMSYLQSTLGNNLK